MQAKGKRYELKGFTLAEVLVTMTLTSLVILMAYTTLDHVRRLFYDHKAQNAFISQYTTLNSRLSYEALKCDLVKEESTNVFMIRRDTVKTRLKLLESCIVLQRGESADTFHIAALNIKKEYEPMANPLWANVLIRTLQFETVFTKQTFHFNFHKDYEASLKLALDKH